MGPKTPRICTGDKVIIKITDMEVISALQFEHGKWSDEMAECLEKPSEVLEIIDGSVLVKADSGRKYLLNLNLVTIWQQSSEQVQIIGDEKTMKELQSNHGEWSDQMKILLGKRVQIESWLPNGDVKIIHDNIAWRLNSACLVNYQNKCKNNVQPVKVNDKVKLIDNQSQMMNLQRGHGGWSELMVLIVGQFVEVVKIFDDGDCYVMKNNMEWLINGECIDGGLFGAVSHGDRVQKEIDQNIGATNPVSVTDSPNEKTIDNPLTNYLKLLFDNMPMEDKPKTAPIRAKDIELTKIIQTPLHYAVFVKKIDICRQLLDGGTDVNICNDDQSTAIMIAAWYGYSDILQLLVSSPNAIVDLFNKDGDTALHLAVRNGHIMSVEILLKAGASIQQINASKYNAFHLATLKGNSSIMELILNHCGGSIINIQKEDKFSALHIAIMNNHIECLKLLIRYQANLDIRNRKMQSSLHTAIVLQHFDCVKLLVENNANLNLRDKNGDTPLHIGVQVCNNYRLLKFCEEMGQGDILRILKQYKQDDPNEIVIYLANKGAILDIKNNAGQTPIMASDDELLKKILIEIRSKTLDSLFDEMPAESVKTNVILEDQIEELKAVIDRLLKEKTCPMCLDNQINVTFSCGHVSCDTCISNIVECHICRKPIEQVIRIYT